MIEDLTFRAVEERDFEIISKFPQNEAELYFMYPKAKYPLTVEQLQESINNRFDSVVVVLDNVIVGFANFYKKKVYSYCSIGNVIINPSYRGKGIGSSLVNIMENIAIKI